MFHMQAQIEHAATVLQQLQLSMKSKTLSDDSEDVAMLRGLMHLINDQRILLHTAPSKQRVQNLQLLVKAAAQAPAVSQAGLAAYALLSPAMAALEDMRLFARGDSECRQQLAQLEEDSLAATGAELWQRSLQATEDSFGAS